MIEPEQKERPGKLERRLGRETAHQEIRLWTMEYDKQKGYETVDLRLETGSGGEREINDL